MGYTTDFTGKFNCTPPLKPEHIAYLKAFSETRRMSRDPKKAAKMADPFRLLVGLPIGPEACYFTGGLGDFGQTKDASVLNHNVAPGEGAAKTGPLEMLAHPDRPNVDWRQPGLWCQWVPTEDGTAIVWSEAYKFYSYVLWIQYWIENFLEPWGYTLNGDVYFIGEAENDYGVLRMRDNKVELIQGERE